MNKYYVYLHRKKTDGSIFYVGKGSNNRAYENITSRNSFWKNISNKHGYYVDFANKNLTEEEAFELEKFLIQEIKDLNRHKLCNLTDGGEGCSGYKVSKEVKEYKRNLRLGFKVSEEVKNKIRIKKIGVPLSEEHKNKIRIAKLGKESLHNRRPIIVTKDGNSFIFNTIKEASIHIGCVHSAIIRGLNKNKPVKKYKVENYG